MLRVGKYYDELKEVLAEIKRQLKLKWDIGAEQGKELKKEHQQKISKLKGKKK